MYNLTRLQASEILGISTRSIDRYIKSGKIRAKKIGKTVMLNEVDIKNLGGGNKVKTKIIIENKDIEKNNFINNDIEAKNNINGNNLVKKADYEKVLLTFEKMYSGFREEIKQKDIKIQELSIELGKLTEQKNNTIPVMELKKVQFINEENKKKLAEKLELEKKQKQDLQKTLQYEKTTNKLLIAFLIIMFIISGIIFFIGI